MIRQIATATLASLLLNMAFMYKQPWLAVASGFIFALSIAL